MKTEDPNQLRLFYEPRSDLEQLNEEFEQITIKLDNFRKSFFQKLSTQASQVTSLQAQIDVMHMQMYVLEKMIKAYTGLEF